VGRRERRLEARREAIESLGTPIVLLIFGLAVAITWIAGITLSDATDGLDDRFHLGSALGGMLLLGFAGTLPEMAITISAALNNNLGMATGNLLGGIAMQTLILALLDFTSKRARPLSRLSDAAEPMLEAMLVILLVGLALTGPLLASNATIGSVSPASLGIVVFYVIGMIALSRIRARNPWAATVTAADREHDQQRAALATEPEPKGKYANAATGRIVLAFSLASLATLAAGVMLERTGDALADRWGINGAIFGATVLAAVTALPEISTGIRAVRLGDVGLAMGDIFGGNAAQMVLFLVADLLAGRPVLRSVSSESAWLGLLGIIVTAIYLGGLLMRPEKKYFRLGPASLLVFITYLLGVVGLLFLRQ
jgi:cation:H+ antiporter